MTRASIQFVVGYAPAIWQLS